MIIIKSPSAHQAFLELISLHSLLKIRDYHEVGVDLPDNSDVIDLKKKLRNNHKFSMIGKVVVLK